MSVDRLVTPDGRPSMRSRDRLFRPKVGTNPRMPMPIGNTAMLHDLDAGVLLQDVGDVGRDAALDVLLIDQLNLLGHSRPAAFPSGGR